MPAGARKPIDPIHESTDDEIDWLAYAREARRDGFKNANEVAKSFQTAATALASAYLAALAALKITERLPAGANWWIYFPFVMFALSLGVSLFAAMPFKAMVVPTDVEGIRAFHQNSMKQKGFLIWGSLVLLLVGMVSMLVLIAGLAPATEK